jgi:alkylation response protein AidB-like acyl-CoA dehydrogenase
MTELGTSSFLRGSETTATFDQENDEFVIHSPTLTSSKWWIGMSGHTATHTVALCNLIIKNERKGLYWFLIPLRSQTTGMLQPGVSAGSLGSKAGRHGLDSGYIQFSKVRIPRENMLMKWATVQKDGTFTQPKNLALSYLTLISERVIFLNLTYYTTSQALTIAIRYNCSRIQNEKKLIDFQSQQHRLMTSLSMVYANILVSKEVYNSWEKAQELQFNPETQNEFLMKLKDFHAISSGLKCWITWQGTEILETCRRSLGGHAYSAYTGISTLIEDFGVSTTGGGDNIVMAQQHVKLLLSYLLKPKKGSEFEYLTKSHQNVELKILDSNSILNAFEFLSGLLLKKVGMKMKREGSLKEAWNNNLMRLVECSKINSIYYILKSFKQSIEHCDNKLKIILSNLVLLYALHNLYEERTLFMENNILFPKQTDEILTQIFSLCKELRRDAVVLVDSFDLPDFVIKSEIGKFDGNIYENYFNKIKSHL